jgi:hypothetical protein
LQIRSKWRAGRYDWFRCRPVASADAETLLIVAPHFCTFVRLLARYGAAVTA